jgi:hypothetical protein
MPGSGGSVVSLSVFGSSTFISRANGQSKMFTNDRVSAPPSSVPASGAATRSRAGFGVVSRDRSQNTANVMYDIDCRAHSLVRAVEKTDCSQMFNLVQQQRAVVVAA